MCLVSLSQRQSLETASNKQMFIYVYMCDICLYGSYMVYRQQIGGERRLNILKPAEGHILMAQSWGAKSGLFAKMSKKAGSNISGHIDMWDLLRRRLKSSRSGAGLETLHF